MAKKPTTTPVAAAVITDDGSMRAPRPSLAQVTEWYKAKTKLSDAKEREIQLRTPIAKGLFYDPKEGTNSFDLVELGDAHGSVVKLVHGINRKVDEAVLTNMAKEFKDAKIPNGVIVWKPEVKLSVYRELTTEQRELFDQCLLISDGSPQLDIVVPKRAK